MLFKGARYSKTLFNMHTLRLITEHLKISYICIVKRSLSVGIPNKLFKTADIHIRMYLKRTYFILNVDITHVLNNVLHLKNFKPRV